MSAARVCFTGHTNLTNGEQANGIPDHVGRTFSPLGLWGILVLDLGNGGFAKSDQHSLGKMNRFCERDPIKGMIAAIVKETTMKKPVLSIDEPEPKKARRAALPPTEGFVTIVDGHFKSEFDTVEAAETSGRELKSAYPMLQIAVYDAANKVRTLLS
jgi:hypothetical protein